MTINRWAIKGQCRDCQHLARPKVKRWYCKRHRTRLKAFVFRTKTFISHYEKCKVTPKQAKPIDQDRQKELVKNMSELEKARLNQMLKNADQLKLGAALREIRKTRGYTVEDVGHHASISTAHIYYIENGHRKPGIWVLTKLCNWYDVDAKKILERGKG